MTPQLTIELAKAWSEKAERLAKTLRHMEHGFALFRPDDVERTQRDLHDAIGWARYWAVQS